MHGDRIVEIGLGELRRRARMHEARHGHEHVEPAERHGRLGGRLGPSGPAEDLELAPRERTDRSGRGESVVQVAVDKGVAEVSPTGEAGGDRLRQLCLRALRHVADRAPEQVRFPEDVVAAHERAYAEAMR